MGDLEENEPDDSIETIPINPPPPHITYQIEIPISPILKFRPSNS